MNKKLVYLGTVLIVCLVTTYFGFARPFRSTGDCMEPAIMSGQLLFVNKVSHKFRKYKINEIIVFMHENKPWYSRVVALENDTINITEKKITINEKERHDNSIQRNWKNWNQGAHGVNNTFKVPPGHVYVLSDNMAANHDDSRHFGAIAYKNILGTAW